jgi:alkanesulfonate monooxygenase SsuD/methylene tetrahydromethanopterin reductase-like flavin-dependent oxidoreductase (luciferase family)
VKVDVALPTYGTFPEGAWELFSAAAAAADEGGVDALWVPDHVSLPEDDVRANGGRHGLDEPFDGWTVLAMLAGRTRRLRFGTEVTPLPFRNPVLLAHTVSSLHALTGGRVLLGLGLGWNREEFEQAAIPFRSYRARLEQTREGTATIRALLAGDPPLVRPARVPILFGGRSDTILRLVAEYGDGWIAATNAAPPEVEAGCARLRELGSEAEVAVPFVARVAETTERARADVEAYIARGAFEGMAKDFLEDATREHGIWGAPEECARKLRRYAELGVDRVILDVRPPDDALDSITRICRDLIPLL